MFFLDSYVYDSCAQLLRKKHLNRIRFFDIYYLPKKTKITGVDKNKCRIMPSVAVTNKKNEYFIYPRLVFPLNYYFFPSWISRDKTIR